MRSQILVLLAALIWLPALSAATYYIDFVGGNDQNSGTNKEQAFRHCPGDPQATGQAKACKPAPGDIFRFRGGIRYLGSINTLQHGESKAPIVYDGNVDGGYGKGRAIVDGSSPIKGWKSCTSAVECDGNPNWRKIVYADIVTSSGWNRVNLHDDKQVYPVAQDPNMPDPHYQEMASHYHKGKQPLREKRDFVIETLGMREVRDRPMILLFDGSRGSAVINNLNGEGRVQVRLPKPATAIRLGITQQPRYSNPKKIRVTIDGGKTVLSLEAKPCGPKADEQVFDFKAPETFSTMTFHFLEGHINPKTGKRANWGAVQKIAAYDQAGKNVLLTNRKSYFQDKAVFTQKDPNCWKDASIAVHAGSNRVYLKKITDFDPARNEIGLELFTQPQYSGGARYSLLNALWILDRPGEYVVRDLGKRTKRIYFWPSQGTSGLRFSEIAEAFNVRHSHTTVRGFRIQGQGDSKGGVGITAYSKKGAEGLKIQKCDISHVRGTGAACHITGFNRTLVEDCYFHDVAWHTKGLVVRRLDGIVIRNCRLRRATSTALSMYTVKNAALLDNTFVDNQGMHANGMCFYVGCENVLVEGNEVYDGNAAITLQDGNSIIIRNNVLESLHSVGIGVWAGRPYHNVLITNNLIRSSRKTNSKAGAIYGGNPGTKNLAIYNNILDGGFTGNILHKAEFDNNIFVRMGELLPKELIGKNTRVSNLSDLVVDAGKRDWRLRPGSKAIGLGTAAMRTVNPSDKAGMTWAATMDVGPLSHWTKTAVSKPHRTAQPFSFGAFKFSKPSIKPKDYRKPSFPHLSDQPDAKVAGADFSGQGGGAVKTKQKTKSIYGWDNAGHWLEWTLEVPEAGNYEICLNLTTATISKRAFQVNGEKIDGMQAQEMTYTGGWRQWTDMYLPKAVKLAKGKNVVRVTNVVGSLNVRSVRCYRIKRD